MSKEKRVIVLIPAYNEEERIARTVLAAKSIEGVKEVYVADDASSDSTAKLAKAAGALLIQNEKNLGKGASLSQALKGLDFDIALLLDGDLAETASEGAKLLKPVLENDADMAIADFPKASKRGGFGLVKGTARWGIARLTGRYLDEPLSGQRAIRRELLEEVLPFASGFGLETALSIDALKAGFRVIEVPVIMTHAETGRDLKGFIHRGKQFLDVVKVIIERLR